MHSIRLYHTDTMTALLKIAVVVVLCIGTAAAADVSLTASVIDARPIRLAETCLIQASVTVQDPVSSHIAVFPFVNGTQWGAWCNISLSTAQPGDEAGGSCELLLPLPYAGKATIELAVLAEALSGPFFVGEPMPATVAVSSPVVIDVQHRDIGTQPPLPATQVGMEWEPWFTKHNDNWNHGEAIPVVGQYDSFNEAVLRQHAFWMRDTGVDFIVVDWTNNLWNKQSWSQRGLYAQELINATTFMLEGYQRIRAEQGHSGATPGVVLLLGLDNGASESMACLNEEVAWIAENYLSQFEDLWVQKDGKPLLVVFDGGNLHANEAPLQASQFTVRWMGSQLQSNPKLVDLGYWSWMDGSVDPVSVHRNNVIEVLTVTPAFFAGGGWLGAPAHARFSGSTFLTQLDFAGHNIPEFLIVCQWNEFNGQPESPHGTYADSYSVPLSNDIEPTSLTLCGLFRPTAGPCGGWGYFYLNLFRAGLQLLASGDDSQSPMDSTLLTVSHPVYWQAVDTSSPLLVSWTVAGAPASDFVVTLDGNVAAKVSNTTSATIKVPPGPGPPRPHTVTVACTDCQTRYQLSAVTFDDPATYKAPASATIHFLASSGSCDTCAPQGCPAACRAAGLNSGVCVAPNSHNPGDCCQCW